MVLYGRNSVCERLLANPASIEKVFLQENFRVPHIEKLIREKNVPVERVSPRDISRIKNTKDLQGIAARVDEFKYTPFKELLGRSPGKNITFIFLDRINDPQNLGVIIRILACFGGFCAVIPKFEACSVTEAVLHVASGGENYVPVSMVPNLSNAIIAAKKRGYWIAGALVADAKDIDKVSLPFPLGLVLGSEGKGIRHGLEKQLDMRVHIPMNGARLSLNVNTACAILCHEISKERGPFR